jgi:hypothetical protein
VVDFGVRRGGGYYVEVNERRNAVMKKRKERK